MNITRGAMPKTDEVTVAWAIETAETSPAPKAVSSDGKFSLPLTRIGSTPVYAGVATLPDKSAFTWHYEVSGKAVGGGPVEVYLTHPDSKEQPGVPKGSVKQMPPWQSKIFEGTTRDWWIYVPAQYKPENPACVMVFQHGQRPKDYVPTVFDNLIHRGDMPVTVGVFINPGVFPNGRRNRSFEYDSLSDRYVRMLLEEILPEVEKTVKLRHDAVAPSPGPAAAASAPSPPPGSAPTSSARCSPGWAASPTCSRGCPAGTAGTTTRRSSAARRRSRSASSCKTARMTWTTSPGTGRWRTSTWRSHSRSKGTTTGPSTARLSQQQARPSDPSGLPALALAGLHALMCGS